MAKSVQTYSGYDSCGRPLCLAKRADGVWFHRRMEQTGYGYWRTKWQEHEAPTHPKKIKCMTECAYAPEYIDIPECDRENYEEWGFSILKLGCNEGLRLPNASN